MTRLFITIFLAIISFVAISQVPAQSRFTNVGRIGLTVNNYGTFGRPTVRSNTQGPPSLAFPRGSGIEHLFEAGIWIGALVNGQVRVSTSSVDASSGYSTGGQGFEFSQTSTIKEKSKLPNSSNYSSTAVSHQDFLMTFTDSFVVIPGTSIPISGHQNPLGATVELETYTWNSPDVDFFVICNYKIKNASQNRWDSVFLGAFSDMVVRNVNYTRDAGTAFFNKGRNAINKEYMSFYAYQSFGDDIDFTKSYGAIQFLGMDWRGMFFNPNKPDTFIAAGLPVPKCNFNFWNFNSIASPWNTPSTEQERYLKLSTSIDSNVLYTADGPINGTPANWLQLLSNGPLVSVEPGETFNYTIAFVCAKQREPISKLPSNSNYIISTPVSEADLLVACKRARSTFLGEDVNGDGKYDPALDLNQNGKLDRFLVAEPPNSPKTKIVAGDNKIEVYWDKSAEYSVDPISRTLDFEGYRLYRTNVGDDLKLNLIEDANRIGQWDSAGNDVGFNNGFKEIALEKPISFEGDTTKYYYKYTLNNLSNGWQYLVIVTAFDEGDKKISIDPKESSFTENENRVFPGTEINNFGANARKVAVYPNPYSTTAAWDGNTSRTRKLYFNNLPASCEINIYTGSGDLVAALKHESETYNGNNVGWSNTFGNAERTTMSGGEHAWDLLSDSKTQLSTGVYLFTVKDLKSGEIQNGNFAIIK